LTSCKPVSCSGRTLHHGVSKQVTSQLGECLSGLQRAMDDTCFLKATCAHYYYNNLNSLCLRVRQKRNPGLRQAIPKPVATGVTADLSDNPIPLHFMKYRRDTSLKHADYRDNYLALLLHHFRAYLCTQFNDSFWGKWRSLGLQRRDE